MFDFRDYMEAVICSGNSFPVEEYRDGYIYDRLKVHEGQSLLIELYSDGPAVAKKAYIYRYEVFDNKEIRFVISCAGHRVSINVKDNGGIVIRNTEYDKPEGDTIFCGSYVNAEYALIRYVEEKDEKGFPKMKAYEKRISPEEWSTERVLNVLLDVIKNEWNSKRWQEESVIIFDVIKDALVLAVEQEKEIWLAYLRHWEHNYQKLMVEGTNMERYAELIDKYNKAISVLESKEPEKTGGAHK